MPKKKHRRGAQRPSSRSSPSPVEQHRRRERDLQALLAQFALWRRKSVPQEQADEEAQHVEPLLRLKGDQLDSPDPTYWTEELIEVLLTEVAPRKIIQPREMTMAQAPALGQFFAFLAFQGRWHRDSLEVDRARQVLEELEFTVLEAADDPTARSFSGNLFTYASSLGVSLDAPEQLEALMQWYNTALTVQERREITDTGRLAHPSTPFDPADWIGAGATGAGANGAGATASPGGSAFFPDSPGPTAPDDEPFADLPSWPWFLPEETAATASLMALAESEEDEAAFAAEHAEVPLVQRAGWLLEFIGQGRPVTATGALKLVDVRRLAEEWDLDLGPFPLTTMWQVDQIVGPWIALVTGGWLSLTSTRVRPGDAPAPYVSMSQDPQAHSRFARAVMIILLFAVSREDPEENGLEGGADTMASLLFAAGPDGLDLPDPFNDLDEVPSSARTAGSHPALERARMLWRTRSDLSRLARYGLLWREGERADGTTHFHGSLAVFAAVIASADMLRVDP